MLLLIQASAELPKPKGEPAPHTSDAMLAAEAAAAEAAAVAEARASAAASPGGKAPSSKYIVPAGASRAAPSRIATENRSNEAPE